MTRIDRKHFILQINTKNITRVPPLEKLLARKVMKPSKTAVKTAVVSTSFRVPLYNNANEIIFDQNLLGHSVVILYERN